jgi:outer membrane protein assembly factor BamB
MADHVNVMAIWLSKSITKNTSIESNILNLDQLQINGFFSAQLYMVEATNTSTVKLQWGVSNDGTNFIYSSDAGDDIVTAFKANSGPGSDGRNIYSFDPITAKYLRFKATETETSTDVTAFTMDVAIH